MKKTLIILTIFISINSIAQPVTQGILGYWPFNSNTNDESSSGNNGTNYGAVITTDRNSNSNAAYLLNGTSQYISLGGSIDGIRTLVLWFMPSTNINTNLADAIALIVRDGVNTSPGYDEFTLQFEPSTWANPGEIVFTNGQGNRLGHSGINSWTANVWHFVAITIDATVGTKMYIDGNLVSSNAETTPINNIDANTVLGKWGNLNIRFFNGKLDDVTIYNRALTETEIQLLYTGDVVTEDTQWNIDGSTIYYTKGNVGIGTTSPDYELSVNGTIGAKEVIVTNDNWPDFVFAPNYQLKTLNEVECFIKENQHLPDVPSAKEIAEDGISLGEMNALLLQKIEELTLYVIEQQKEIENLKNKLE